MDPPQPDFPLMSQSAVTFAEQIVRLRNLPAIDAGAAILERLDALTIEIRAINRNTTARIRNGTIAYRLQRLIALVNPTTGEPIPKFPATPAALSTLSAQDLSDILVILGEDIPQNADTPEKQRLLRISIGLVDIS